MAQPTTVHSDGRAEYGELAIGTGTNYINVDVSGHITLLGNATTFLDQLGDAVNLKTVGTSIVINSAQGTITIPNDTAPGTIASPTDFVHANYQLNHNRKLDSNIYPHFHFFSTGNNTAGATGNMPNLVLEYRWQKNGAAMTTSWTAVPLNFAVFTHPSPNTSNPIHQIAYNTGIPSPAGSTISDIIQFRLTRDAVGGANFPPVLFAAESPVLGSISGLSLDVHYEIDSLGSNTEYSK